MYALLEIQTVDELQRMEAKLGELGKQKDQLESELVEFKSDLNQMVAVSLADCDGWALLAGGINLA